LQGLSSRSLTVLHEIEKTMNPMGNYAPYREIEAKKHATFIPFFGNLSFFFFSFLFF